MDYKAIMDFHAEQMAALAYFVVGEVGANGERITEQDKKDIMAEEAFSYEEKLPQEKTSENLEEATF